MTTLRRYYTRFGGYVAAPAALAMALGMLLDLPPGVRLGLVVGGGLALGTLGVIGVALMDAAPLSPPLALLLVVIGFAESILLLYRGHWLGGPLLFGSSAVALMAVRRVASSREVPPTDPDPGPPRPE